MKVFLAWFCFVGFVVSAFVGVSYLRAESEPHEKDVLEADNSVTMRCECLYSKNGKRCIQINRFACPKGWGPQPATPGCDDELEECESALDGIKAWCDPACFESLEDCLQELQIVREACYRVTWDPDVYY